MAVYNCECDDDYPRKTLAQMREFLMIRLGWAAMKDTPLPGIADTLNSFLVDAQEQIYRQYKVFRLERFFTWQMVAGLAAQNKRQSLKSLFGMLNNAACAKACPSSRLSRPPPRQQPHRHLLQALRGFVRARLRRPPPSAARQRPACPSPSSPKFHAARRLRHNTQRRMPPSRCGRMCTCWWCWPSRAASRPRRSAWV